MPKKVIEKNLTKIFEYIGVDPDFEIEQEDAAYKVYIEGDDLSFLIGYKGESLNALQHILGLSVFRELEKWHPIYLDINNYKDTKLKRLDDMIKSAIDRVRFHQKEVRLPKLSSYERRYVHTFVSDYMDVESESRGEGRDRYLYLMPKN